MSRFGKGATRGFGGDMEKSIAIEGGTLADYELDDIDP